MKTRAKTANSRRLEKKHMMQAMLAAALMLGTPLAAQAQSAEFVSSPVIKISESDSARARRVVLGVGKSIVIDLPRDAKEVFVANPTVANAVIRSTRKAFLIGTAAGQTSVFFLDAEGRQIAALEMDVNRDLLPVRSALRSALPNAKIQLEAIEKGVILSGSVGTPEEAARAVEIAGRFFGGADSVVNSLVIRSKDQVMLKVTVAEVQRSALKQLGVDLSGSWKVGDFGALGASSAQPISAASTALGYAVNRPTSNFSATVKMLERNSLLRTLAEPNLTAVSGGTAAFNAGGEVPVPTGRSCTTNALSGRVECTTAIEFKKFGVKLDFTPVVLSEGRINLKVKTEVSELSADSGIQVGSDESAITIPGFKNRSAETTVELPSGASMAVAGLIQEQTKTTMGGVPGAKEIPVLGALFRSRDYLRNETELVIMVTPYIAQPVARQEIALPDDGFADASDPSANFLGKVNRIYGVNGGYDRKSPYSGRFGFITD